MELAAVWPLAVLGYPNSRVAVVDGCFACPWQGRPRAGPVRTSSALSFGAKLGVRDVKRVKDEVRN